MPINLRNVEGRYWCFTINNPTPQDEINLDTLRNESSYLVYQLEQGKSETPHYQGYVEFSRKKRGSTIKNLIPRAHLERRQGTSQEASNYCKKCCDLYKMAQHDCQETRIDGPFEYGNPTDDRPGTRNDLKEIKAAIDQGKSMVDLWQDEHHFGSFSRYYKSFREYMNIVDTQRSWKTRVVVLTGRPGSGKSTLANLFPRPYVVPEATSSQFFDGYDPRHHQSVILDDYSGGIKFTTLLKLMDEHQYRVNVKGGMVTWKPYWLIITSNKQPDQWYLKKSIDFDVWPAFMRRIDYHIQFYDNYQYSTGSNIGSLPEVVRRRLLDHHNIRCDALPTINDVLME